MVTLTAGIILEAPRQGLKPLLWVGVISYSFYLACLPFFSVATSVFIACLAASLLSQVLARVFKMPVTIFYVPTFYLYVPGAAIYRTAFYFIQNDIDQTLHYLVETLLVAGAIALGVFVSDSLLEIYQTIKYKRRKRDTHD